MRQVWELKKINEADRDGTALSQTLPLSFLVVCIASPSSSWTMIEFFLFLWKMTFSE